MINQVILVGRIVDEPTVKEVNNKKVSNITLAIQRPYKNNDGIYETDFIDCSLWNATAETTAEYCKKGDLVGIKGNLQTSISNNGIKNFNVNVDRITFLASKKKTDDIEQEKDIKI